MRDVGRIDQSPLCGQPAGYPGGLADIFPPGKRNLVQIGDVFEIEKSYCEAFPLIKL